MYWEQALLYPLLFAAAAAATTAAVVIVRLRNRRLRPETRWFVVLAVGVTLWAAGTALSLETATAPTTFGGAAVVWLGVVCTAVTWPLFVAAYTGRHRWLRATRVVGLSAIPAATYLAVLTNPLHGLFVTGLQSAGAEPSTVAATPGPILVLFVAYTLSLDVVTLVWLYRDSRTAAGSVRRQYRLVLVAGVVPFTASVTHLLVAPHVVDFTPVTFGVTVPLLGLVLLEFRDDGLVGQARNELLEALPDGVIVVDDDDRIVDANTAASRLLGDVVGDRFTNAAAAYPALCDLDPADDGVEITATVDDQHVVFDARVVDIDHQRIRAGRLYLLRDVTERRRSEVRYQTLVEDSSALVSVLDDDGRITYASPAHETVLGFDSGSLTGEDVFSFVHPEDRERVRAVFGRLLSGNPMRERVEYRFRANDGTWRRLESMGDDLRSQPFLDGIVITTQDVTDRVRDTHRLDLLNRVLRHDVRNAMNVIEGNASLIADQTTDAKIGERAETIAQRARSLAAMSNKARTLDRAVTEVADASRVDVAAIVQNRVEIVRASYPDVTWDVTLDGEFWARVDPLVGDAIENAVENAAEHSEATTPSVGVTCEYVAVNGENFVEVRVTDDCPPIPEQDRRVLEHGEESALEHGSGIGTWFVNWIVTASGGSVDVTANEDGGNTVRIRLPRADSPPA